jgi:hypothetical protein
MHPCPGFCPCYGDRSELFDTTEEILNKVAAIVKLLVIVTNRPTASPGRYDGRLSDGGQGFQHPFLGVIGLVGNQRGCSHAGQKMVCTDEVMGVPAGHMDAHGIAKRINQSVDFGAQSATGTTNGLIR